MGCQPLARTTIQTGIDYLRVTTPRAPKGRDLARLGDLLLEYDERDGYEVKEWHWQGYRGSRSEHTRAGVRHDGVLLELSGGQAEEFFDEVMPLASNVARLDLQTTDRLNSETQKYLHQLYKEMKRHADKSTRNPLPGFREKHTRGITIDSGNRQSDLYLRAYDKERESGDAFFESTVRYELEIHNERAKVNAFGLHYKKRRTEAIDSLVRNEFSKRGARSLQSDTNLYLLGSPIKTNTCYKKLEWLATGVKGTIQFLKARGKLAEAVCALGLSRSDLEALIVELDIQQHTVRRREDGTYI